MHTITQLNTIIPEYDFHEKHKISINAQHERVYTAAKAVTAKEILIFRILIAIRDLPAKIMKHSTGVNPDIPLLEDICKNGFTILSDIQNSEIVFGIIGQFWKLTSGNEVIIKDANDFIKFNEPIYLKAAGNLRIDSFIDKTTLTTETRVLATSKEAKRRFRIYWIIIRLGSGLIRRMWLKAIKRRAESGFLKYIKGDLK